MPTRLVARPPALPVDGRTLRTFADQALSRTAGAPLTSGNHVRLLRDAAENYPAWEAAIGAARRTVHVEMYIFHRDPVGRRFADLLAKKAREGVIVRVAYDWFGCGLSPALGIFRGLVAAGGDVRPFNPPSLTSALGWLRRDHRKVLVIDSEVAFIAGLCIGQVWEGRPEKQQEPWRDTGVEIRGPAVGEVEEAFAASWRLAGGLPIPPPIQQNQQPTPETLPPTGATSLPSGPAPATPEAAQSHSDVSLRIIPTEPFTANMLRLDLLIASIARRSLWITDAYFIGTGPYLEALKRAARDGVDVRLLLPQGSDVGWTVPISRSLYRPLLEAGVRIFEWSGTMIHAKTAVADGRWARIGSTNLNLNSWIGNWEMDVAIEDEGVARTLAAHYEDDLARSTEIVLTGTARTSPPKAVGKTPRRARVSRRVARTVATVGRSLGAAVSGNRELESFEFGPLATMGAALAVLAALGFFAPRLVAYPLAALAGLVAFTLVSESWQLWRRGRRNAADAQKPAPADVTSVDL